MAKSTGFKNTITYVGIVISFFVFAYLFMSPVLDGKRLRTHDLLQWQGMAKELSDFRAETGEEGLWTNSMFCGMPGYLILVNYPGNLFEEAPHRWIRKTYPASVIVIYCICFFILLCSLKINRWLSLIGAIAFAFSSYFIIIIGAGHTSKAWAIGYLPLVVAGVLLSYKRKFVPGAILFAVGLTFELVATHYQITYYGAIMLGIYVLVELIFSIKEKTLPAFAKSTLYLVVGAIIALGINVAKIFTTYEYSQQSIRGPSELTREKENRTDGLNKDYVVRWSQGIDETLTLLIPNFKGGSTDIRPDSDTESYQTLRKKKVKDIKRAVSQIYLYHGGKPGTSGPYYVGAIIVFLFVLGLFLLKGRYKWWLAATVVVAIVLSWGKHVMGLTSFLLEYLPMYNKFRAPEMILVIAELAFPLLALMTLNNILKGEIESKDFFRGLKWSFFTVGGVTLLFALAPGIFDDFVAITDHNSAGKLLYPEWLMSAIIDDRKQLLQNDAFRSFVLVVLAAAVLFYAFYKKKMKPSVALIIIGVLIAGDLWFVDKRYLNENNFEKRRESVAHLQKNVADVEILKDKDVSYRVLPLSNPFNNTHYSYYHKNVMGYHAAKLSRPHEVMDGYVVDEMEELLNDLKEQVNPTKMPSQYKLINMLNARYIIYSDKHLPLRNPYAMGNAWFVSEIRFAENADDEFDAIKDFDPHTTALVDKRFKDLVPAGKFTVDPSARIVLQECVPNYLKYDYKSGSEQFVVFSEVYYDKGWDAYIDGAKVPHLRVNYMLRGMVVPEGEHKIEFRFEPKSYFIGNRISLASSVLLFLLIAGYAFFEIRKNGLFFNNKPVIQPKKNNS